MYVYQVFFKRVKYLYAEKNTCKPFSDITIQKLWNMLKKPFKNKLNIKVINK